MEKGKKAHVGNPKRKVVPKENATKTKEKQLKKATPVKIVEIEREKKAEGFKITEHKKVENVKKGKEKPKKPEKDKVRKTKMRKTIVYKNESDIAKAAKARNEMESAKISLKVKNELEIAKKAEEAQAKYWAQAQAKWAKEEVLIATTRIREKPRHAQKAKAADTEKAKEENVKKPQTEKEGPHIAWWKATTLNTQQLEAKIREQLRAKKAASNETNAKQTKKPIGKGKKKAPVEEKPKGTALGSEKAKGTALGSEKAKGTALGSEKAKGTALGSEKAKGTALGSEKAKGTALASEQSKVVARKKKNGSFTEDEIKCDFAKDFYRKLKGEKSKKVIREACGDAVSDIFNIVQDLCKRRSRESLHRATGKREGKKKVAAARRKEKPQVTKAATPEVNNTKPKEVRSVRDQKYVTVENASANTNHIENKSGGQRLKQLKAGEDQQGLKKTATLPKSVKRVRIETEKPMNRRKGGEAPPIMNYVQYVVNKKAEQDLKNAPKTKEIAKMFEHQIKEAKQAQPFRDTVRKSGGVFSVKFTRTSEKKEPEPPLQTPPPKEEAPSQKPCTERNQEKCSCKKRNKSRDAKRKVKPRPLKKYSYAERKPVQDNPAIAMNSGALALLHRAYNLKVQLLNCIQSALQSEVLASSSVFLDSKSRAT